MLRPRILLPRLWLPGRLPQRRCIHKVRDLPHDFVNNGVGDFLSRDGIELAWTQIQTLAIEKLNRLTNGTELDSSHGKNGLLSLVLKTARDPNQAPIFNNASMAYNNEFFFEGLAPAPVEMPTDLKNQLTEAFGSVETLRRELIVTGLAMFGPGYVWLVRARNPHSSQDRYRLLPTYLAGTPYPEAHWRQQRTDMNTADPAKEAGDAVNGWLARNKAAVTGGNGGGPAGKGTEPAPGGLKAVTPVLCVSTWEHSYLPDYGVITSDGREGKREYLERWWDFIDWNVVAQRAKIVASSATSIRS